MGIKHSVAKVGGQKGFAVEWNANHTIENDTIQDKHIDWGAGANQVNTDDMPESATKKFLTTVVQTIAGVKTFSSFPITPSAAPTANYEVANKKYVDDNIPIPPGTYYWSTAGSSFHPSTHSYTYVRINGTYQNTHANPDTPLAPVYLPHGAVVTACVVYGSNAARLWFLERKAANNDGSVKQAMASANINSTDSSISNATIDNSTYVYWLSVASLAQNEKIYGAIITYTL